jgi:NAD(P)-dependent dehydrogenase (short-subunit alcohol dehydrogenase family)
VSELDWCSGFILENPVVIKTKLGRDIRKRIALRLDGLSQRANRAKFSLFRKQRAALRASSFGWGCRHRILLAIGILLDFVQTGLRKESAPRGGINFRFGLFTDRVSSYHASRETFGPISILVNNAGISIVADVLDQTPENWDKVSETNLNACFLLSKLAAQSMVKQRQGKIVNLASIYSFFGSGFIPFYSAAKGALVQLTKSSIEVAF